MNHHTEKKTILVVDDDEILLSIAEDMLKARYKIVIATSGNAAIDILLKGSVPDLILLDIIMPDMDGWDTYKKLRGISLLKDVPVAFITSLDDKADEKAAEDLGAAGYIVKLTSVDRNI